MNKQQGAALLTALFVMTIVVILVVAVSQMVFLHIHRLELTQNYLKLNASERITEIWAKKQLEKKSLFDSYPKNKIIKTLDINPDNISKITIHAEIQDAQAKFNLNNLQDNLFFSVFIHLIKNVYPELKEKKQIFIVGAAYMWVKPFQPGRGFDEITKYYQTQKPPYQMSHQPMHNKTEFRLIYEVDKKLYNKLSPYITALPEKTPINIYTASEQIIKSLGNGLEDSQVSQLITLRNQPENVDDKLLLLVKNFNIPTQEVTINSQYFDLYVTVKHGDVVLKTHKLLKRNAEHNKISVAIIN
jgi:general secretion pathway protein K